MNILVTQNIVFLFVSPLAEFGEDVPGAQCTVCPRTSDPLNFVTNYKKLGTISWTDGSMVLYNVTMVHIL